MFYASRHFKLLPTLLTALIALGMWTNAIAAASCPHMMGSSDCCLMQTSHSHSHDGDSESAASTHNHVDNMNMSDMDMQEMSMDDMKVYDANASQTDSVLWSNGGLEMTADTQLPSGAITQTNERCSHCMMHSPSGSNVPLSTAGQSSASFQVVTGNVGTAILKSVPSSLTFVELHDHGPPGSSAPLYVLVSAFRI